MSIVPSTRIRHHNSIRRMNYGVYDVVGSCQESHKSARIAHKNKGDVRFISYGARLCAHESLAPSRNMKNIAESRILLDVKQASELTSLGRSTLYILMRSGELASIKVGKKRLILGTAIDAFVERRLEAPN